MLNENIKKYRKEKGFSQETLAQELSVVRQTVSKWEKGLSVPDAEMLTKISEVLDVPVMTLLGGIPEETEEKLNNSDIANQLYILNNQFAKELYRRRKVRRIILTVLLCLFVILPLLLVIFFKANTKAPVINGFTVEQVDSEIFTQEEIDTALEAVVDIFEYSGGYHDCELKELCYAGDDIVEREMKYQNSTYENRDYAEGEFIIIKTVFHTGRHTGGGFNSNFTYDNWYFLLEKTTSGKWAEIDHGFL